MLSEEFEFSLSQYLDGTLSDADRAAVEQRLATDPEARAALEGYRRLDGAIRASAEKLPAIRWDRLAEHLSDAVADQAGADRVIKIVWARRITAWAAAALVLMTVGIFGWQMTHQQQTGEVARIIPPVQPAVIEVAGPVAEPPAGPTVMEIAVGRPAGLDPALYADDGNLVVRRPLISIAAAATDEVEPVH